MDIFSLFHPFWIFTSLKCINFRVIWSMKLEKLPTTLRCIGIKWKKKLLLIKSCGGPLLIRWVYKIIYSYTRRLCEFSTMCYEHSGDSNELKKLFIRMKIHGLTQNSYSPNVSTTPLRQWGFRQCLSFSWTSLRGKHCRHPIAVLGVVDIKTRSVCSVCQVVRADVRPQWVL